MADVRRQGVDLPLFTIQRVHEVGAIRAPEVHVEAAPELSGLGFEPVRQRWVPPGEPGKPSRPQAGVVRVALDFAERNRWFREPAVREETRVPGVLPALVDLPFW